MIRVFLRAFALVFCAIAIVTAVLDITRSIADSQLVVTSLSADWRQVSPGTLAGFEDWLTQNLHPLFWDPVMVKLLAAPSWAVFAIVSLIFAIAASRRRRSWQERLES